MLVMLISVLLGKCLEIIPMGVPYSSHPAELMVVVLVTVVLCAVVVEAITMVVMLLMLLMALFNARSGDRTGRRWSGLEAVCRQGLRRDLATRILSRRYP